MTTYQIVMSAGPTPGKIFELTQTDTTIGRDIHAGIVINVPEISRRHARFRREPGTYSLEDLGSTNGTFVNGQRLTAPYLLRSGDTIMLGEAVALVFEGGGFDPNATVVSSPGQVGTVAASGPAAMTPSKDATMYAHDPLVAPPTPRPMQALPITPPPVTPAFSRQVPAGPADFGEVLTVEEPKNRTWLWAGLGCLVVILCGCVAGAILFDMMDMYCQPPFDSLLSVLYTCP